MSKLRCSVCPYPEPTHALTRAPVNPDPTSPLPRSITGADAMRSTALLVGSGFNKLWQMTVVFGGIELVLSQVGG